MSNREFDEFKEMYMDKKSPIWMNTRAEISITEHRASDLEEMNMIIMNVGKFNIYNFDGPHDRKRCFNDET